MRAAGSAFARKPTNKGGFSSLERPSATSACKLLATDPARMTLHDAGVSDMAAMAVTKVVEEISRCSIMDS